jgi:hypothetical protein
MKIKSKSNNARPDPDAFKERKRRLNMFGLFGPRVPKQLHTEQDFKELEVVLASDSTGKKRKAIQLIAESGPGAQRCVHLIEPMLQDPEMRILAAQALWRVNRDPRAAETIKTALQTPLDPKDGKNEFIVEFMNMEKANILATFSQIAKDDSRYVPDLLGAIEPFITTMATSRGTGDSFDKVINVLTSGDDNKSARYAAAALTQVARDHEIVRKRLIATVNNPQSPQQKKYAALALGFSCYSDVKKMNEQLSFMNTFFDHPDLAMTAARNKIRDEALTLGLAYAEKFSTAD